AIYLGDIRAWSDPRIKKLNPKITLPNILIAPIYRSDGSGVNHLFTDYLSRSNSMFAEKVGVNTAVEWPNGIGAKGNDGVANLLRQTDGAIAYVEYAYVKQLKLTYASLINRAGAIVAPSVATMQAAAAGDEWLDTPSFSTPPIDQPCEQCWPLTGASFA